MTSLAPKIYSHSRRLGMAFGIAYIVAAMHTVLWLSEPFPDLPPVLSLTILGMYGINTAKAIVNKKVDNGQA